MFKFFWYSQKIHIGFSQFSLAVTTVWITTVWLLPSTVMTSLYDVTDDFLAFHNWYVTISQR